MATRRLDRAGVRALALALPDVVEGAHHGTADFRVRGKIFATLPAGEVAEAVVKAAPVVVDALVRRAPGVYRDAWGGRWVGVRLDAVEAEEVAGLVRAAYRLVAPKGLGARVVEG